MAGVEAVVRECYRANVGKTLNDVTAVIPLTFSSVGTLVLGFSWATASALAERVLAESGVPVDDEMIRDCVGEIANVVAGQTKVLLRGTRFHFTHATPTVLIGTDRMIATETACFVVGFTCELGEFTLHGCT